MAVAIITGFTLVNEVQDNANLSQGKGVFNAWTHISKSNLSVGQAAGNLNTFPTGLNMINDCDFSDSIIIEGEIKPPVGPSIAEVV